MSEEVNEGMSSAEVEIPQEDWQDKQPQCLGIHINGNPSDMICFLTDDSKGNRWIIENPAEIHYKQEEAVEGGATYKIVFVPASAASVGTLFVPFGELNCVCEPRPDIKSEYMSKFTHSNNTETKLKPNFEG